MLQHFEHRHPGYIVAWSLLIAGGIGTADLFVGGEISTSIFYVLPIALGSWYGNRGIGIGLSLVCAVIWAWTDFESGHRYSHPAILYWNALVRLGLFFIITVLLAGFREALRKEELAADTDSLTGLLNSRGFFERLAVETVRAQRFERPFTVAYLDVDNFKAVNDTLGHPEGDRLLVSLARALRAQLRKTDVVSRLGGDEFIVLMVETGFDAAETAFTHARNVLRDEMAQENWPVTFSIGMVTFESVPDSPAETIQIADQLMYTVKRGTKDGIVHNRWKKER